MLSLRLWVLCFMVVMLSVPWVSCMEARTRRALGNCKCKHSLFYIAHVRITTGCCYSGKMLECNILWWSTITLMGLVLLGSEFWRAVVSGFGVSMQWREMNTSGQDGFNSHFSYFTAFTTAYLRLDPEWYDPPRLVIKQQADKKRLHYYKLHKYK